MFAGDQGELRPTRTNTVNGLTASSQTPLRSEFTILQPINPDELTAKAKAFLHQFGIDKQSSLPPTAPMVLIGEPRLVQRSGARIVVWKVLNGEVPGWRPISNAPADQG